MPTNPGIEPVVSVEMRLLEEARNMLDREGAGWSDQVELIAEIDRVLSRPSQPPVTDVERVAAKRIGLARKVTYDGMMGEFGKRNMRDGEWVNGIRVEDFDLVIAPAIAAMQSESR